MSERRIIRGATVLALDGRRTPRKTDLLIEDGKLAAAGGVDTSEALLTDARGVVLPGLVQTYVHLTESLLDGGFAPSVDPRVFRGVQIEAWRRTLGDAGVELATRAGLARGLAAGVTAFGDASTPSRSVALQTAVTFGVRYLVAADGSAGTFRDDLTRLLETDTPPSARVAVSIRDASAVSTGRLRGVAETAFSLGVPILAAVGTGPGRSRKGLSKMLRAGVTGPRVSIAQIHDLSPVDARRLSETETTVVLTPAIDLLTGAPPPPLETLLEAGVPLALGSDVNATRIGFDLFAEARLLLRFLDGRVDDPASRLLEMMAPAGARALGLPGGSIEVGGEADLVMLDVEAPQGGHEEVARRIVDQAGPSTVRTVWVGGQIVASEGRSVLSPAPEQEEETGLRRASVERVVEAEARSTLGRAIGAVTRGFWRARGWRI